ncbi:unnamed protein product [Chilo suppressalis]|uniref:SAM domain-containing protein n=1 Tax=Chilo suppressalis TaxID=168631 RepID=A0ABN8BC78_CHISP|nr:hypothetical protein evm_011900 [Chilo suppressalis]CAH0406525.1 unnamed protein product [Chilo suppressalis]
MADENSIEKLASFNKINPTGFDVTVSALLLGVGGEKYVDIFKKKNISQCTLTELTNEDLIKLGIDDANIRKQLLEEVKNLPLYADTSAAVSILNNNLNPIEILETLEESSQHLYRIYLSVLANTLAVKKTKHITDCLIYKDKYASDIAIATLSEITNILNSMDIALHTQLKTFTKENSSNRSKKIIVGTLGSAVIGVLTVFFVRSLKDLK